ncbi:MAG TPA: murein L,D-transpeptidase catalytic domain family protein [Gemmatimonadaceae bacterium]|nr:murein L,D-transpeptidase catalytic domain family protein [Gemmatimonadaceae bacterium]
MRLPKILQNGLIGATAVLFVGSRFIPGSDEPGPVLSAAAAILSGPSDASAAVPAPVDAAVMKHTRSALEAFSSIVRPLSHPKALETAFRSYFAFKAEHPDKVKKPLLYFVDYGKPSTEKRGYVFDMEAMTVVEGPFTVAHGRGSQERGGIPTRFSNRPGSAATSLGLYVAQETYGFRGTAGGRRYSSIGLRLAGVSGDYNDNARRRGVVAHGAPYVTSSRAGRSEGCPAMEQERSRRLLPRLANGGMVFLFAPEREWMTDDPWVVASAE